MEKIEIANTILKHFIAAGYKTTLDLSNGEIDSSVIVVQIDVGLDPIGSFAFFFSVNDDDPNVEFSCIYEFDKPVDEKDFMVFEREHRDELGVFSSLLYSKDDGVIHLYAKKDKESFSEVILDQVEASFADPFGLPSLIRKLGEGNLGA
ncbi:MAG: hypothetical protein K6B65_01235 [Bacilli bacterium]|nr:hypothetical protein [Bacilli bacterium]